MKNLKNMFLSVVLFLFLVTAQLFSSDDPKIIDGLNTIGILFGTNEPNPRPMPAERVMNDKEDPAGVRFTAKSIPEDISLRNRRAVALNYSGQSADGSRLKISFGNNTITADDLYDWILLPTAMYADSDFYNCVTMSGNPKDIKREDGTTEIDRGAFDNLKTQTYGKKSVYWVEYHPALVNTFAGLNLFLVDAMLIEPDLRTVTDNIGVIKGYNDKYVFAQNASDISAKKISDRMALDRVNAGKSRLELTQGLKNDFMNKGVNIDAETASFIEKYWFDKTYHSYIFSEHDDESMSFRIEKNRIVFTGNPYYKFFKQKNDSVVKSCLYGNNPDYEPVNDLTADFRTDADLFKNLNPAVFNTAAKIAQWSAFFRYAKENNPEAWRAFINQIKPAAFFTTVDGSEIPQYRYKIDSAYDCRTPRSLDLLQKRFGKEIENEYAEFAGRRRQNAAARTGQTGAGDITAMGKELSARIAADGKPAGVLLNYAAQALESMANISHFQILDNGILIIGEKSSSAEESAEKVEWIKAAISSIFFYKTKDENDVGSGVSIDPQVDNISEANRLFRDKILDLFIIMEYIEIGLNPPQVDLDNFIKYINRGLTPQKVRFIGGTENTDYGYIFFEADRLMKCLEAGRDNINNDIIYTSETVKNIIGFKNLPEIRKFQNNLDDFNARFWLTPKYELYNDGNSYYIKGAVIVNTEEMYTNRGKQHPVTQKFAEFMTKNYDLFCREYPVFKKLQQIAEITALIQELHNRGIDMGLYRNISVQERKTPIVTPTIWNMYFVRQGKKVSLTPRNGSGGVDFNFSKPEYMEVKSGLDTINKEFISNAITCLKENPNNNYSADIQVGGKTNRIAFWPTKDNAAKKVDKTVFSQIGFNKN